MPRIQLHADARAKIGVYEVPASAMHGLGTPEDLDAYLARRPASAKGARS